MGTVYSSFAPRAHRSALLARGLTAASALLCAGLAAGCSAPTPEQAPAPERAGSAAPTAAASASSAPAAGEGESVQRLEARVIEKLPMLPGAFTQGLEVDGQGKLLAGTGQHGESQMLRFSPGATTPEQAVDLPQEFFGEGITQHEDSVWQLTWQSGTAIRRDAATLEETGRANYSGEGWGLCSTGAELVLSDGTSKLRHLDPHSFAEVRPATEVTLQGQPLTKLNELECVGDEVYANVWMSSDIYRIDPATGKVTAVIGTSELDTSKYTDPDDVLNGIAHIPDTAEFWLTGKRWDELYRVRFE